MAFPDQPQAHHRRRAFQPPLLRDVVRVDRVSCKVVILARHGSGGHIHPAAAGVDLQLGAGAYVQAPTGALEVPARPWPVVRGGPHAWGQDFPPEMGGTERTGRMDFRIRPARGEGQRRRQRAFRSAGH